MNFVTTEVIIFETVLLLLDRIFVFLFSVSKLLVKKVELSGIIFWPLLLVKLFGKTDLVS